MLVFLDVIPDELLSQPCGLPGCKLNILEKQAMADDKPGATLITGNGRHFNQIGHALAASRTRLAIPRVRCFSASPSPTTEVREADAHDRDSHPVRHRVNRRRRARPWVALH